MFFVFPCPPTQLRDRPNIAAVLKGWCFATRVILLRLVSEFSHYTRKYQIATWQTDDSSADGSKVYRTVYWDLRFLPFNGRLIRRTRTTRGKLQRSLPMLEVTNKARDTSERGEPFLPMDSLKTNHSRACQAVSQSTADSSDVILWNGMFWCSWQKCWKGYTALLTRPSTETCIRECFVLPCTNVFTRKRFAFMYKCLHLFSIPHATVFSRGELVWREFRKPTEPVWRINNASS